MTRIRVNLSAVDTTSWRCAKPRCRGGASRTLHRHHVKHEAMWVRIWSRVRRNQVRYKQFVERYHSFHPDDCVLLCPKHHAEVHHIYDRIIKADRLLVGRSLVTYSWKQAEQLMSKLQQAFNVWVNKEETSNATKSRRQRTT